MFVVITYRPATSADAKAVAELMTSVEAGFGAVDKPVGEPEALEYIEGVFAAVASEVLLDRDVVVGFVAVQMDAGRRRHYVDIFAKLDDANLARALQRAIDGILSRDATSVLKRRRSALFE